MVVYGVADEDDAVFQEAGIDIVGPLAASALLDDHWDDVIWADYGHGVSSRCWAFGVRCSGVGKIRLMGLIGPIGLIGPMVLIGLVLAFFSCWDILDFCFAEEQVF